MLPNRTVCTNASGMATRVVRLCFSVAVLLIDFDIRAGCLRPCGRTRIQKMLQTRKISIVSILLVSLMFGSLITGIAAQEDDEFSQTESSQASQDEVQKAIEAFNAGQDAHASGDLDKALRLYTEALRLVPEFPEAEYQSANIYLARGQLDRAEGAYRRAIEFKPEWTLPMAALGNLLVEEGKYSDARTYLLKALAADGMCIPCYPALTAVYLQTGADKEVLKDLLQKLTILTQKAKIPASVWAAKAALERYRGDVESASKSLKRAFEVDAGDTAALSEAVEVALDRGDSQGALAFAKRLSSALPLSSRAKIKLARAEYAAGDTAKAISLLESLEKENKDAAKVLATIRTDAEEDPAALAKMLVRDPGNARILGKLCAATRRSDPEKSLDYCLRASKAEPTNINHAIGYASALIQLHKYGEAAGLLTRLEKSFPDNYTIHTNLATALFQLDQFEAARKEYEWIIDREPDLAAAYYFLAICNDRMEFYLDALAGYEKFLNLADPDAYKDEISRVELRLPILRRQIKEGKGKKRP